MALSRHQVLKPSLKANLVEMTTPDKGEAE